MNGNGNGNRNIGKWQPGAIVLTAEQVGRLREGIRASGIQQRFIARKIGLSEAMFSRKLNGTHDMYANEALAVEWAIKELCKQAQEAIR